MNKSIEEITISCDPITKGKKDVGFYVFFNDRDRVYSVIKGKNRTLRWPEVKNDLSLLWTFEGVKYKYTSDEEKKEIYEKYGQNDIQTIKKLWGTEQWSMFNHKKDWR